MSEITGLVMSFDESSSELPHAQNAQSTKSDNTIFFIIFFFFIGLIGLIGPIGFISIPKIPILSSSKNCALVREHQSIDNNWYGRNSGDSADYLHE